MKVYKHHYDPAYPVVCLDEANRQLIEKTGTALPAKKEESRKPIVNIAAIGPTEINF